jgi:hypothetical protein
MWENETSMTLLPRILRLCVVMLFSAFGTNMAFAVPMATSDITYLQTEATHFIQANDVGFAARAPPMAVSNVAATGGVTVMQGGAFSLHGQETVAALFGFERSSNAPNRIPVPDGLGRTIHPGAQDKHIPGTNNYDPARSTLTAEPQVLLEGVQSGQYPIVREIPRGNTTSYIVDFGSPIGDFKKNGTLVGPTQYGQIVQGKNGVHIIPANPSQY